MHMNVKARIVNELLKTSTGHEMNNPLCGEIYDVVILPNGRSFEIQSKGYHRPESGLPTVGQQVAMGLMIFEIVPATEAREAA